MILHACAVQIKMKDTIKHLHRPKWKNENFFQPGKMYMVKGAEYPYIYTVMEKKAFQTQTGMNLHA